MVQASSRGDGNEQSSGSSTIAKLAKIDTLPGAQVEPAIGNGHAY